MTGREFAAIRQSLGLTRAQLARVIGLSKNGHEQVKRIETGAIQCAGPTAFCMDALLAGFRPADYEARVLSRPDDADDD